MLLQNHEDHAAVASWLRDGGRDWIRANKALIRRMASEAGTERNMENAIRMDLGRIPFVVPEITATLQEAVENPVEVTSPPILADLTVIIPCHNYARYLGECLQSIKESTAVPSRVIVIDDSSNDDPVPVAEQFGVEFHKVEFGSLWKVCKFGFSKVRTKYVAFMDADDTFDQGFIAEAIGMIEADRNTAFAFPRLLTFGDPIAPRYGAGTEHAPTRITARDVEFRNWCPMSTVFRSEVLRQSVAFEGDLADGCTLVDWRLVRNVLRAGPWHGVRTDRSLNYRIHPENDHKRPQSYATQADLSREVVTIVVALSGRWDAWGPLRNWIELQSWPREQTRLLILNSTHGPLTAADLGLDKWHGAGLQIERINVGRPGLADEQRVDAAETCQQVEAAVAGLYNRAFQIINSEFVLFVEDDVIPESPAAIASLMSHVAPDVAAITGIYRHRYFPEYAVAFSLPYLGLPSLKFMDGPDHEQIGGSGFGCLLTRRSIFKQMGMAGDNRIRPHYDCEIAARVADAGYRWIMDRTVKCDHLVKPMK